MGAKPLAQILDEQCAARMALAEVHVEEIAETLIRQAKQMATMRSRKIRRGFTRAQMMLNLGHLATCHGKELRQLFRRQREQRNELEKIAHLALQPLLPEKGGSDA